MQRVLTLNTGLTEWLDDCVCVAVWVWKGENIVDVYA